MRPCGGVIKPPVSAIYEEMYDQSANGDGVIDPVVDASAMNNRCRTGVGPFVFDNNIGSGSFRSKVNPCGCFGGSPIPSRLVRPTSLPPPAYETVSELFFLDCHRQSRKKVGNDCRERRSLLVERTAIHML